MPDSEYRDLVTSSYGYKDGRIDAEGHRIACVELPEKYESVPTQWRNQAEVVEIQEQIEDVLGTTFETRQAARALLKRTQNPGKLRKILSEYKHDSKFCTWAQGVGLRAFAFKSMVLTKYYAVGKAAAARDWYERNRDLINR